MELKINGLKLTRPPTRLVMVGSLSALFLITASSNIAAAVVRPALGVKPSVPDAMLPVGTTKWTAYAASGPVPTIVVGAGPGGSNAFVVTGTGRALQSTEVWLAPAYAVPVTPGQLITATIWVDQTNVLASPNQPYFAVSDSTYKRTLGYVYPPPGQAGTVSIRFAVPAGITHIGLLYDYGNQVLANGATIKIANPSISVTGSQHASE